MRLGGDGAELGLGTTRPKLELDASSRMSAPFGGFLFKIQLFTPGYSTSILSFCWGLLSKFSGCNRRFPSICLRWAVVKSHQELIRFVILCVLIDGWAVRLRQTDAGQWEAWNDSRMVNSGGRWEEWGETNHPQFHTSLWCLSSSAPKPQLIVTYFIHSLIQYSWLKL